MIHPKQKIEELALEGKVDLSKNKINVGLATCGISAGAMPVFDALKSANLSFDVDKVGCIGMCYAEPLVTVIEGSKKTIYGYVTEDNVQELIEHIREGKIFEKLFLAHDISELEFYKNQKRLVMNNCGIINPYRLNHYLSFGGYSGLINATSKKPLEVVEDIKKSGLRGRGGAGFPTGLKWSFLADKPGLKYLICNGDEGDPGAFMNRTLMESDPFKIIEGMTIGAYATGCTEGIIYTRAEYPLAIKILQNAINIAYKYNLLGSDILGVPNFNFDLKIQEGAGAFVCGEESALINSLEGKRGQPNPRPPFPAQKGFRGLPTLVNNVGTWGHVTTIMNISPSEYIKFGTEKTKGTKIICLTGKINRTGVVEVPFGIPLRDLVFSIGGGMVDNTKFKALLSGGPAGGFLPADKLDTPLDYESLSALGTIIGSGGFIVANDKSCIVNIAKFFIDFTQQESCGKCTPCREGSKRLLELLTKVTRGTASKEDISKIEELSNFIMDSALCGLGQNAANPVLSSLKSFKEEYDLHIVDKKCPAHVCENLLTYTINNKCIGCGNCKRHCPVAAISGEPKAQHVINQDTCIKCGACYDACAFESINRV
ncbi:MAG: NADH-ubiquinone oxidoreductase-F iron-sulfur binding region domain-containing protein [Candidatus Woesearchaeota archaeon]